MPRTKEQNAAYQRAYRARKAEPEKLARMKDLLDEASTILRKENEALRAEIMFLKRELAKRPSTILPAGEMRPVVAEPIGHAFNSRPFRPAPKP